MQTTCPNCSNRIVIDDARVPDKPFGVKCPKCQNLIKLPGKAAAAAAPPPPPPPPEPVAEEPAPAPPPAPAPAALGGLPDPEELKQQMMAQLRREMAGGSPKGGSRALIAVNDRGLAAGIAMPLSRQGYALDTVSDHDEASRLIEQGLYNLVVTTRQAAVKGETVYQRLGRLSPELRRRIFLVLLGEEYKTGDGTQAWSVLADLVIHTRDVPACDTVLQNVVGERTRLYQVFVDARRRFEEHAG